MKTNFKNIIYALMAAIVIVLFAAATPAGERTEASKFDYTFTSDTITNAENDTLEIPYKLFSKWEGLWAMEVTVASGSRDVTARIYENPWNSGEEAAWVLKDSIDLTSASHGEVYTGVVRGVRQRVVVDGSGTQSSIYTIKAIYKKD